MHGVLNINKPLGLTSHDVVAQIRRGLRIKKVGHAGTLDPLATGVLIVCLGNATRLSEYLMATTKRYQARVKLGISTTTYDAEGTITAQHEVSGITQADIEAVLPRFLGAIDQLPPIYSAIKQGGKKLYELARDGQTVTVQTRAVRIDQMTIQRFEGDELDLDVICSAGTYIRSLAYDLGQALGVGGHLAGLTRTRSGVFTLENAVTLPDAIADPIAHLVTIDQALSDWPTVVVTEPDRDHLWHGRAIPMAEVHAIDTLAHARSIDGETIALLRAGDDGQWHPYKVFHDV
ncbi:MAG: tRNA pseudouridine(55) synthase TruB [Anaerolineae bacterium]|jgi:tRNA pseudouridine55 synthase|nr:tRNA pseudouridine(55) synthase TruB [Anaerolineae bacterium]